MAAICKECGESFPTDVPRPGGKYVFCTRVCNRAWHQRNDKLKAKKPPRDVVCPVCDETFASCHAQKMYCSPRCKVRVERLRQSHGLTIDQYKQMLVDQDGRCGACRKPFTDKTPHVDHCHASGKVRALLHPGCNIAVGMVDEDVDTAWAVASYIARYKFDLRDLCAA